MDCTRFFLAELSRPLLFLPEAAADDESEDCSRNDGTSASSFPFKVLIAVFAEPDSKDDPIVLSGLVGEDDVETESFRAIASLLLGEDSLDEPSPKLEAVDGLFFVGLLEVFVKPNRLFSKSSMSLIYKTSSHHKNTFPKI